MLLQLEENTDSSIGIFALVFVIAAYFIMFALMKIISIWTDNWNEKKHIEKLEDEKLNNYDLKDPFDVS